MTVHAPWVTGRAAEIAFRYGGRVTSRTVSRAVWQHATPEDVALLDAIPADGRWHRLTPQGLGRWDGKPLVSTLRMLRVSRLSWLLGRPTLAEYEDAFTPYRCCEPTE